MKGNTLKELAMRAKNRMMKKGYGYETKIKIIENDESEFVERVRKIMIEEENCVNPIKILMDEKVINRLDDQGKEKYLLETVDKYLKAKEIIERQEREVRLNF